MSAERLRELATEEARRLHNDDRDQELNRHGKPIPEALRHPGRFETCPHPDCVLVRSALGDTGLATPAAPLVAHPEAAAVPLKPSELDELERRLAADEPHIREHTRAWALVAIRQLRATPASLPQERIARLLADTSCERNPPCPWTDRPDPLCLYCEGRALLRLAVRAPSGEGRWQPIDRMNLPKGRVLLTNNISARDADGRMSHVWYEHPIASDVDGGSVVAFDGRYVKVLGITHFCELPLPAPPGSGDGPRVTVSRCHTNPPREGYVSPLRALVEPLVEAIFERGRKASSGEPLFFDRLNLRLAIEAKLAGLLPARPASVKETPADE